MSTEEKLPEDLKNRLKPCPVDWKRVNRFVKRAKQDLRSAKVLKSVDLEGAYEFLYDSMLHGGLAYLASRGIQPDIRAKHKTVIDYMAFALPKRYESKVQFYDRMRKKRHQLIYDPGPMGCTEKEFAEAERVAEEFLKLIESAIRSENPQNKTKKVPFPDGTGQA
jgi:uncharacterized protein (UPF0332 family)